MTIRWHDDDPKLLRDAIDFTATQSGFPARLVEKDYFCSVALEYLTAGDATLAFKGGTCLAKIYTSFYRLSEDLDFSISIPADASRANRRKHVACLKEVIAELPFALPALRMHQPLHGANQSTQYAVTFCYTSLLDGHEEPISIEVGLREPHITEALTCEAGTLVTNPLNQKALVDTYYVHCLSYPETMAEKLRAALCRREVAIRDFFDIDYAVNHAKLDFCDAQFLELLRRKIAVPGTLPVDVTEDRLVRLQRQLQAQLRPVLREQDFVQFDMKRAIETVRQIARKVA